MQSGEDMGNRRSLCSFCLCTCTCRPVIVSPLTLINNLGNSVASPALTKVFIHKESNCINKAVG